MRTLWQKLTLVVGIAGVACALAMPASAAYLYAWGLPTYTDTDDVIPAGEFLDIRYFYTAQDATYYYFRVDVDASVANGANNYAYQLYFDTDQNSGTGVNGPTSSYVDNAVLGGIDRVVDTHYITGNLSGDHYHQYDGIAPDYFNFADFTTSGGLFQDTENGFTTLEWAIPHALLGTQQMNVYFATQEPVFTDTNYDNIGAGGIVFTPNDEPLVPEPGTFALMGVVGVVAGVVSRRRKTRQG